MNRKSTSPTCRPRTTVAELTPEEILEELRQLRASIAIYRKLVERLMERAA